MRMHWIQHVPFEGPGSIENWAKRTGYVMTSTHLYRGDLLPEPGAFDWLVVMGGPMNIYEDHLYPWLTIEKKFIEQTIAGGKIVIGICLGAQLIADVMGRKVYRGPYKEIGWFPVYKTGEAQKFTDADFLPDEIDVFHWHGDTFDIPEGAVHIARSNVCPSQGFIYDNRVIGLQFHLETTMESAQLLIENCGNELVDGMYIQKPDEMLADAARFKAINRVMEDLLNSLD